MLLRKRLLFQGGSPHVSNLADHFIHADGAAPRLELATLDLLAIHLAQIASRTIALTLVAYWIECESEICCANVRSSADFEPMGGGAMSLDLKAELKSCARIHEGDLDVLSQIEIPPDLYNRGPAGHGLNANLAFSELHDLSSLIERAQRTVSGFETVSRKLKVDFCDTAIFLACGVINFGASRQNAILIQFANQSSIADYLRMSRETVRRRLVRLEEKKLIYRASSGYIVSDLEFWLRMVKPFK